MAPALNSLVTPPWGRSTEKLQFQADTKLCSVPQDGNSATEVTISIPDIIVSVAATDPEHLKHRAHLVEMFLLGQTQQTCFKYMRRATCKPPSDTQGVISLLASLSGELNPWQKIEFFALFLMSYPVPVKDIFLKALYF